MATPIASTFAGSPADGFIYRTVSFFDFHPQDAGVQRAYGNRGCYTTSPSWLWATVDIPQGARVRELLWGTSQRSLRTTVPSSTYGPYPLGCKLMLGVSCNGSSTMQIGGVEVAFSHGGGDIGMLSAPVRVYDSRDHTKLSAGVTRTITLPTSVCPAGTTAVSVNIIVVAAEGDGYLRAWPGNLASTEASAVSFLSGKTTANAQILGVSASRQIKVWSSKRAHVVVDVTGTIG